MSATIHYIKDIKPDTPEDKKIFYTQFDPKSNELRGVKKIHLSKNRIYFKRSNIYDYRDCECHLPEEIREYWSIETLPFTYLNGLRYEIKMTIKDHNNVIETHLLKDACVIMAHYKSFAELKQTAVNFLLKVHRAKNNSL